MLQYNKCYFIQNHVKFIWFLHIHQVVCNFKSVEKQMKWQNTKINGIYITENDFLKKKSPETHMSACDIPCIYWNCEDVYLSALLCWCVIARL